MSNDEIAPDEACHNCGTPRTGRCARDYLDGIRARYTHPIRYAIATCTLWWGVMATVVRADPT